MTRMPVPYSRRATNPVVPFMVESTAATSPWVNTTGSRREVLAASTWFNHGKSTPSTSL